NAKIVNFFKEVKKWLESKEEAVSSSIMTSLAIMFLRADSKFKKLEFNGDISYPNQELKKYF
ncbi:11479_t:CDS:2, partial [Dentiscutata erythropus]